METTYRNFYRNFYMRTGGFIPTAPLNTAIYPGDFFQIRNGEMILLENIFRKGIVDRNDIDISYGQKLNPVSWNFSDGISKPFSGRGSGHAPIEGEFEFSRQIISFSGKGSFFFKSNNPESVKIANWSDLQQQLIIKLTQTLFSFRELYLVTETVTASDWTLAIASSDKGELELASDAEEHGFFDIFGHESAKTIQSRDIGYYHRETNKRPAFFRAKKLVVQEEKLEVFISDLVSQMQNRSQWATEFFHYDFYHEPSYSPHFSSNTQASVLDMLQANELNPNTALLYFKWAETSLDDIEKLFLTYGA